MNEEKDPQARFLRLFLKHQAEVKAFISSLVRNRTTCDDVFQEVALIVWRDFDRYDSNRPFTAWVRGIAAHKIMQDWEKSKRSRTVFSPEAMQVILDAYARTEADASLEQEALQHCLERLPQKSRSLLMLRYEMSLKLGQIADQVNNTLDAVHKALSRVRAGLQKCMESYQAANPGDF